MRLLALSFMDVRSQNDKLDEAFDSGQSFCLLPGALSLHAAKAPRKEREAKPIPV